MSGDSPLVSPGSQVTLVQQFGTDLTVVNAARVSFGKRVDEIHEADRRLLRYLARNQHWSPFRHVYLQLHVRCPEFVARQLYKHAVGIATTATHARPDEPWNEVSGRYVPLQQVYRPPPRSWREAPAPGHSKQGSGALIGDEAVQLTADAAYTEAVDKCCATYAFLIKKGVAQEQARMVLPMSFMTEFYWTASLQAVAHLVQLRTAPGAQQETRDVARLIEVLAAAAFPCAWEAIRAAEGAT